MTGAARVRPMTSEQYEAWRRSQLTSYAEEMVASGLLPSEPARRRAEEQHDEFLPQGRATPRIHLVRVLDERDVPVGVLWVGPRPRRDAAGFVYDVEIEEEHRGGGYGRGAMLAAEAICRDEGWDHVALNVFGPNAHSRDLYESLGYPVVTTTMAKPLN